MKTLAAIVLSVVLVTPGAKAPDVDDAVVKGAIEKGVAFLLKTQKKDGSWGSPARTFGVDIMAPGKGSHDAFKVGSCSLAISGLVQAGWELPGVRKALERAGDWLIENHEAKRDRGDVIYSTWAHAYALGAFGRLLEKEKDPTRRAKLIAAANQAVKRLASYEFTDGGWGYYDFRNRLKHPSYGRATSFTTAAVLVGMRLAADQGVEIPERLTKRAVKLVRLCRLPDGAYSYGFNLGFRQPYGVNKKKGSLARTPACLDALRAWDDPVPTKRLVQALDDLETYGHFLLIARKYPRPHESWYQNSGYFCFFGYYHASRLLSRVPAEKREFHRKRIQAHLVALQEKDGAWWDYQLYGYHKAYGTGYVLLALQNCLDAAP